MDKNTPPQSASGRADAICKVLEQGIRDGEWSARLPTEQQLVARFGVSRPVVREALARLKGDGLIVSRQGSGAFVVPEAATRNFRLVDEPVSADVLELRLIIETGAAELAALRRSESDLAAMRAALEEMEDALARGEDGSSGDDAFHRAIAAAASNAQLERLIALMSHAISASRKPTWSEEGHGHGRAAVAQVEHRALLDAIIAGDAGAARTAARKHLLAAAERFGCSIASVGDE